MPDRKWENDSDKVLACKMRKQINPDTGEKYTNAEIKAMFYRKGKLFYEVRHNNTTKAPKYPQYPNSDEHGMDARISSKEGRGLQPNNTQPPSPPSSAGGSFSLPSELTYQAIEQAVILNMYNPDKERTSAINLARQLLETKEKMAILSKESDEIYSQLTKLDSSELRLFVKPNHKYSSNSSENNTPIDSFEDN